MEKDIANWARRQLTEDILPYWEKSGPDTKGEGFFGEIDFYDNPRPELERSVVMVSRHLWTFSAAARFLRDERWLKTAKAAFDYLINRFLDKEYGGFYWAVRQNGESSVTKKQSYGQAFAIYALVEYARCPYVNQDERDHAGNLALSVFQLLESNARDRAYGAYREALERDWSPTLDRRLSPADLDCEKSMNTNLHVMEAYTNLFRYSGNPAVAEALYALLDSFSSEIVQADGHLALFFDEKWRRLDTKVSYGHDIEASWLIEEALTVLDDTDSLIEGDRSSDNDKRQALRARCAKACEALAFSALTQGWDEESGALEEEAASASSKAERKTDRIWWCQAEAIVGFIAAYQRGGNQRYLEAANKTLQFIERSIKSPSGDWLWGRAADGQSLGGQPKGGNWKTGYHNGRMCMELIERLEKKA